MVGKAREREISDSTSAGFIMQTGFIKCAYFSQEAVLAPIVTSIIPNSAPSTGTVNITNLGGANFQPGAVVKLSKIGQSDIIATNEVTVSSSKITCTFDLTGAASGSWDVTVTNPDTRSGTLPAGFTVNAQNPTVTSISPSTGDNSGIVNIISLQGTNFKSGATVKLTQTGQNDIVASNVVVASDSVITCQFGLTNKSVGLWNVVVTNTDNLSGILTGGFKIESSAIKIIGPINNDPNPFNPDKGTTTISYKLSRDATIDLFIYDIRGERVWAKVLPAGSPGGQAGMNYVIWNGLTDFNSKAGFGVYILIATSRSGGSVKELAKTKIAIIR